MKPITLTVLLACLSIGNLAFAQSENQKGSIMIFLKNDGREVDRLDSADFVRVISALDTSTKLYNISEYNKDKTLRMMAQSVRTDYMRYEGPAIWFYPNGKKKEACNFRLGDKTGDDYEYYPNGKLYLHKKYQRDSKVVKDSMLFVDYRDSTATDTNLATNGNGLIKVYYDNFARVYEQGVVKNGLRDGEWKGESGDQDHRISFTEVYENGTLKTGKAVHSYEKKTYTYTVRNVMPQFSGGMIAFVAYLAKKINYPSVSRLNKTQGTLLIAFVVQTNGKLSDFKMVHIPDIVIASEAMRVLAESPAWAPGYRFGKKVRVSYTVPINFSLEED